MSQKLLRLGQLVLLGSMVLGVVSLLLGRDVPIYLMAVSAIAIAMLEDTIQFENQMMMMREESPRLREMRRRFKEADDLSDVDLDGLHPDEWEDDR